MNNKWIDGKAYSSFYITDSCGLDIYKEGDKYSLLIRTDGIGDSDWDDLEEEDKMYDSLDDAKKPHLISLNNYRRIY